MDPRRLVLRVALAAAEWLKKHDPDSEKFHM